MEIPEDYYIDEPNNAGVMYLEKEILEPLIKYMPHLNFDKYKSLIVD